MPPSDRILIRATESDELERICEMERGDARRFIITYSLARHRAELKRPNVLYKSIWKDSELVGFLILVLDPDNRSVEFRRIVISMPGRGYGKVAVRMVEDLCRHEIGRERLWLDVFETNERARHVYERSGYKPFGTSMHEGRALLLYEKTV